MSKSLNLVIEDCEECPMRKEYGFAEGSYFCSHEKDKIGDSLYFHGKNTYEGYFPDWCPLKDSNSNEE